AAGSGAGFALACGAGAGAIALAVGCGGIVSGVAAAAGGGGSSFLARSCSSAVLDQRQAKSWWKSLVKPPVRTRAQGRHASRIVAAIDTRRVRSGRLRVATAQATKASTRVGTARTGNRNPIAPVRID